MMKKIEATSVSSELMNIWKDGRYMIHSRFQSGFNVRVGKYLCFVGNKFEEKVPFGLLLQEKDVDAAYESVKGRNASFLWSGESQELIGEDICICLEKADVFSNKVMSENQNICQVEESLESVINQECRTGFGCSISQLFADGKIDALWDCFQSEEEEKVRGTLRTWIGRGQGLTPSGDDFLIGIMLMNEVTPVLGNVFTQELAKLVEENSTTDISVHYYRCAFEHLFVESAVGLVAALRNRDLKKIREHIEGILRFGHTSGCDMTAGILAASRYHF